jgi:hypothetical protein
MNVWEWFGEFRARASAAGDRERLRLTDLHHQAYQQRYADPDRMLALTGEGRRLAEVLGEPWWALFYDYWYVEGVLTYKGDYRNLLERAVALALEARKPTYERHPLLFNIRLILVRAYLGVDPVGHARAIEEALDYLIGCVSNEGSGKYLLLFAQQGFAQELEQWDQAHALSLRTLALLDQESNAYTARHYRVWAHAELCPVLYGLREWEALGEWAGAGEELARSHQDQYEVARLLLWRAVAARRARSEEVARRCVRLGSAAMERLKIAPAASWYTALCAYHEMGGHPAAAWEVRERQLRALVNRGQIGAECRCRLERCRLLVRMGRPVQAELTAAREAMGGLREAGRMREELDRLEEEDQP